MIYPTSIVMILTSTLVLIYFFFIIEIEMVWSYKLKVNPIIKLNWVNEMVKNIHWCNFNQNHPTSCIDFTTANKWEKLQLNGK